MLDKEENKKPRDLLDPEDYEYEKEIYNKQLQQQATLKAKSEEIAAQRRKREKEAQKERERQIARDRLELIKKKSEQPGGEQSDEEPVNDLTEQSGDNDASDSGKVKMSFKKKVENFIYLNKWWLIMATVFSFFAGFILYTEITRERPDMTIYMIADNGLQFRQPLLEEFFEEYIDDIDGNGYVHVSVQIIPLDRSSNSQEQMDNNTKFLTELYSTENMLIITDSNTDDYYMEIMDHDLPSKFTGNKYVDERGFSLNMKLLADKLEFEDMPNDIHISIRQPVATVDDSLEVAQKNYEKNFKYLKMIIDDLTAKAEQSGDPGLTTLPKQKDDSSSSAIQKQ